MHFTIPLNRLMKKKIYIIELVVLFIEDFKFVKKMHTFFHDKSNFLGAIEFLAGGYKTQTLHFDYVGVPPRVRGGNIPVSVLIPIGNQGRNIHFETITEARHKHHIRRGEAVWFEGNVLHAGAIAKAQNPIDNLALHIHIDSTTFLRKPNNIDISHKRVPGAYDSSDDSC